MIKELEQRCVDFFMENITVENVFSMIQYCVDFESDKKLLEKCKELLQIETQNALKTEAFKRISAKGLTVLLEQDPLNVSEIELFKAVSFIFLHYSAEL